MRASPSGKNSEPGALGLCLGLVAVDRALLFHGEADIVEPVHQAVLAEGIDLEFYGAAIGSADFLAGQIDRQRRVGTAFGIVEQFVEVVLGDADRQNAVLETVVVEDVAERGRDHAADAEIEQRPWRVFAAGAAAEIVAGDQHLGAAIGRLVEDEIRVLAAVVLVALFREQPLAEAGALDGLQILLGDDHVGVYIDDLQRRRDAFQRGEFFHRSHFLVGIDEKRFVQGLSRMPPVLKGKRYPNRPPPRSPPYRRRRGRKDGRSRGSARGGRSVPASRHARPSNPGSGDDTARSCWVAARYRYG